jgi:hypothetical protein
VFLAEYYKFFPEPKVFDAMQELVDYFAKHQEPKNGGWWKWLDGAYTERTDYSVVNHGYVTSLVISFFYTAKQHRVKVPENTFKTGETALMEFTNQRGVGYGLPRSGKGGWGDKTAGRGIWVALAANYVQRHDHQIYTTYKTLLPKQLPNLDQGHHVGAFHGLAVTLGAHMYGPEVFKSLTDQWLDKLIRKQEADGGLYIGDDGDAGGEPGLLKGNYGSTAAFALMIRLHQDPNALRPPTKKTTGGPAVPTTDGKSPFSTKEK